MKASTFLSLVVVGLSSRSGAWVVGEEIRGLTRVSKIRSKNEVTPNKPKRLDAVSIKGEILLPISSRLTNTTHAMIPTMQKRLNYVPLTFSNS